MRSVFALLCLTAVVCADVKLVVPPLGEVLGTTSSSAWSNRIIYQFLSLRYAQSPTGPLRFLAPVPELPWSGVYNATVSRRECPQINVPGPPGEGDVEDCLTLNVFTPIIPDSSNNGTLYPVMVYIHGGAFVEGRAHEFPPNYVLEKNVLLVVIQYRLGPLGYMSLQTDGIPGNAGMLDQVLALQWVNKHIKYFGGDNSKVTIFGQSAGAASVSLHLLSPAVDKSLFQQVILQSGSGYGNWVIDDNPTLLVKEVYAQLTDITEDVPNAIIERVLKNCTVTELHNAVYKLLTVNPSRVAQLARVVVQEAGAVKFLVEHPEESIRSGRFRTLPLMAGVTKHDGSFVTTTVYDIAEFYGMQNNKYFLKSTLLTIALDLTETTDISGSLSDTLSDKYFKEIFDKSDNITFRDASAGYIDIMGMFVIKSPTMKHTRANAQYNNQTYLYTLDYKGEHTRFGYGTDTSKYPFEGGIHHSDDLLYLFPYHYTLPLNNHDTAIAKDMVNLWTGFVINGKPSSPGVVDWAPVQKGTNGPYLHINSISSMDDDFVHNEYYAATEEALQ